MKRGSDPIDRLHISKEERDAMILAIIEWFNSERDEQLGNLGADMLLRFILREIGPALYNQGIRDAARYLYGKIDDLAELEI